MPDHPICQQYLCQVFEGHHQLLLPLEYKNKWRDNYFKITSLLVTYCDSVTILKSFIASNLFQKGGGEERRAKAFFCHAEDFLSDVVEAGWPSG